MQASARLPSERGSVRRPGLGEPGPGASEAGTCNNAQPDPSSSSQALQTTRTQGIEATHTRTNISRAADRREECTRSIHHARVAGLPGPPRPRKSFAWTLARVSQAAGRGGSQISTNQCYWSGNRTSPPARAQPPALARERGQVVTVDSARARPRAAGLSFATRLRHSCALARQISDPAEAGRGRFPACYRDLRCAPRSGNG